ncbi:CopG family transcriptional regulator [Sphingobium mellinum]|uniref:CopG family transcriptional regulator n=1 Tax=Sphingobium mellinum TaxID=1387166 RepID=UPI0030EE175F
MAWLILRGMKTFKTRHQFYLPDDLSAKLDALTASPGTSKTQILTDALNAWLERKGAQELNQRFGPRLDRQNRTAERLERKVDVLTEMLGVFILHQLTLVAHQPPFDGDTARLGRTRYGSFLKLVEQRLMRANGGEATALTKQEEQP